MPSVTAGPAYSVGLPPGQTLTIVAGATSSGLVRRVSETGENLTGAHVQPVPASATRVFGPFPTARHFSLECAAGSLSYEITTHAYGLATQMGNVEGFTGAYTLRAEDNGKLLRCDDGSAVIVTVPNDLPQGFNVGFAMWGAGTVTMSAASGATNRSSTSALSTQYNVGSLLVVKNANDATAEFVLGGNFA